MGNKKFVDFTPYSDTLGGCDGNEDFPGDWVPGKAEHKKFLYEDHELFKKLPCRPQEDPAIKRKEMGYRESKKNMVT